MSTIESLIRIAWQRQADSREALVPALIGPSGVGKTARIKALAAAEGRELVVLHAQALLPEDLVLPRPRGRSGHEHVSFLALPQIARCREPGAVLFVDEFDKAVDFSPATASAMLSLLWERRLQDIELHSDTLLVVACQPAEPESWSADELRIALARRLLWLPIGADWCYIADSIGVPADAMRPFTELCPAPTPPVSDPCPRTVTECIALADLLPRTADGSPEPEALAALLRGLFAERWHEPLRELLASRVAPRASAPDLAAALDRDRDTAIHLAESMALADLVSATALPWVLHGCADAFAIALERVVTNTAHDVAWSWAEPLRAWMRNTLAQNGGKDVQVIVWPLDSNDDERLERLYRTLQRLEQRAQA
jgi:MoxR-like ATPase